MAQFGEVENPRWNPIPDEVYLQEGGARQVASAEPLTSVAVFSGVAYAGGASGVYRMATRP